MKKVVAFEGIDYAGKSTLINKVVKEIKKRGKTPPPIFNEPRRDTEEYALLRKMIISPNVSKVTQIHVSVGTRISLYEDHLIDLLNGEVDVITDRCLLTSMVYQQDRNHDAAKILHFNVEGGKHLAHNVVPDAIVYLGLNHEEYLKRLNASKRDEIEDVETFYSKKENFDKCIKDYREALKLIKMTTGCKVIESNDPVKIVDQLQEAGFFKS